MRAPFARVAAPMLGSLLLACTAQPAERIVLVTVDTLRYDAFPKQMPMTAAWSAQCAVFEHFYAASSSTQPTHATLFTGLQPWEHGVPRNGRVLADEHVTLAERLAEAGFGTHAVVASFPVASRFGFAQGFDDYLEEFDEVLAIWRDVDGGAPDDRFYSLSEAVTVRALAALDGASRGRQFFWFHYFDPHAPYGDTGDDEQVTPRPLVRSVVAGELDRDAALADARALYEADVRALDRSLGRLLMRLREDATRIPTHVLLTADHGESLGEAGLLGHGSSVAPEQVRVPTLLCSPGVAPGARADVAGSSDVFATLLARAGVMDGWWAGRDLAQPAAGRAFGMRRTYDGVHEELRLDGETVRIEGNEFFMVDAGGVLYRGDGTDTQPASEAESHFAGFAARLGTPGSATEVDPEVEAGLRALGYVP